MKSKPGRLLVQVAVVSIIHRLTFLDGEKVVGTLNRPDGVEIPPVFVLPIDHTFNSFTDEKTVDELINATGDYNSARFD